jgi:hypothetical protein
VVGPEIPIRIAPLNVVGPFVASTPYGKRFSQADINAAYREEFTRIGYRPNVSWVRPITCDDSEPEHHPFAELGHPVPARDVGALQP